MDSSDGISRTFGTEIVAEKNVNIQSEKLREVQDSFVVEIHDLMDNKESIKTANICKVPEYERAARPEVYVPQILGLGPYHHHMGDGHDEMKMYKVVAAKRIHDFHDGLDFHKLTQIIKSEKKMKAIRASYPLITHIDNDHLACMLAIDGLVFYELLVGHMEQQLSKTTGTHDDIIDNSLHSLASAGRAFVQTTALRDLMMLENQIPFQVFKLIVAAELFSTVDKIREHYCFRTIIGPMLFKIFQLISPFQLKFDSGDEDKEAKRLILKLKDAHHSLDFMYNMILHIHFHDRISQTTKLTPSPDGGGDQKKSSINQREFMKFFRDSFKKDWDLEDQTYQDHHVDGDHSSKAPVVSTTPPQASKNNCFGQFGENLKNMDPGNRRRKTVDAVKSIPEKSETGALDVMLSMATFTYDAPYNLLPNATKLVNKGGLKFKPVNKLIEMRFDKEKHIIHLPKLKLNSLTEAIIKNLVAYENYLKSGALQSQTRDRILNMTGSNPDGSSENDSDHPDILIGPLMSIMDALLENINDVKVLRNAGILTMDSSIPRDKVLTIFKGMSSSVTLSKNKSGSSFYRSFIKETTDYYEKSCIVKARRRVYKFSAASYKYRTFLSLVIIVLLTSLQTFCSISDCHSIFRFR